MWAGKERRVNRQLKEYKKLQERRDREKQNGY